MENWYCIYTKPNLSDSVCKKLEQLPSIEVFNPKLRRKKHVRSRLKEVVEDLFPSYIFSRFDPFKYFHLITYTRGVKRLVGDSLGAPYIVDDTIIEYLKSKMTDGVIQQDATPALGQGDKVLVLDGPFGGHTGTVLGELKPKERVMVLLDALRMSARVELPLDLVARQ